MNLQVILPSWWLFKSQKIKGDRVNPADVKFNQIYFYLIAKNYINVCL